MLKDYYHNNNKFVFTWNRTDDDLIENDGYYRVLVPEKSLPFNLFHRVDDFSIDGMELLFQDWEMRKFTNDGEYVSQITLASWTNKKVNHRISLEIRKPSKPQKPYKISAGKASKVIYSSSEEEQDDLQCPECEAWLIKPLPDKCPNCGTIIAKKEPPSIGSLFEKYGPNATLSTNLRYDSVDLLVRFDRTKEQAYELNRKNLERYRKKLEAYNTAIKSWNEMTEPNRLKKIKEIEEKERAEYRRLKNKYGDSE
jgi:rRNA maturation protein Nop10